MISTFIAIAGGTGAGKSTVAFALQDKYPERIGIIHLDDWQKHGERRVAVPVLDGVQNWDHPNAIEWNELIGDLKKLQAGKTVSIQSKNERLVKETERQVQEQITPRLPLEIKPKTVMILEGYLSLWDSRVRAMLDDSIFLEAHHSIRLKRRTHFINSEYETKILVPMHAQYVEPTKKFAKHVIDVTNLIKEEVFKKVDTIVMAHFSS